MDTTNDIPDGVLLIKVATVEALETSLESYIKNQQQVKHLTIVNNKSGWSAMPPPSLLTDDYPIPRELKFPEKILAYEQLTQLEIHGFFLVGLSDKLTQLKKLERIKLSYSNKTNIAEEIKILQSLSALKKVSVRKLGMTEEEINLFNQLDDIEFKLY